MLYNNGVGWNENPRQTGCKDFEEDMKSFDMYQEDAAV